MSLFSISHPGIYLQVADMKFRAGLSDGKDLPQEIARAQISLEKFLSMDTQSIAGLLGMIDTGEFANYSLKDKVLMLQGKLPTQHPK